MTTLFIEQDTFWKDTYLVSMPSLGNNVQLSMVSKELYAFLDGLNGDLSDANNQALGNVPIDNFTGVWVEFANGDGNYGDGGSPASKPLFIHRHKIIQLALMRVRTGEQAFNLFGYFLSKCVVQKSIIDRPQFYRWHLTSAAPSWGLVKLTTQPAINL